MTLEDKRAEVKERARRGRILADAGVSNERIIAMGYIAPSREEDPGSKVKAKPKAKAKAKVGRRKVRRKERLDKDALIDFFSVRKR